MADWIVENGASITIESGATPFIESGVAAINSGNIIQNYLRFDRDVTNASAGSWTISAGGAFYVLSGQTLTRTGTDNFVTGGTATIDSKTYIKYTPEIVPVTVTDEWDVSSTFDNSWMVTSTW